MRLASWIKPKPSQPDLLNVETKASQTEEAQAPTALRASQGKPLMLAVALLCEDPNNPRTEFPETELDELAEDIRQHGILQPIGSHQHLHGRSCDHRPTCLAPAGCGLGESLFARGLTVRPLAEATRPSREWR
jgi:ParB-like nuclease domain